MEQGSTPHADAAPTLWYYAEGETIHGPFDEASIVELIQNRALSRETWILREGTQKWVALSDTQFAAYLPVSAPPLSESQNAEPPSAIYSHFNKWMAHLRFKRLAIIAGLLLLCVTLFAYHEKRVSDEAAADARFNQSLREIGARVAGNNKAEEESRRQTAEWQQRMKLREDIRAATEPAYGSTEWILRNDQQGRYRDANGNWRTRGDGGPGWRQ